MEYSAVQKVLASEQKNQQIADLLYIRNIYNSDYGSAINDLGTEDLIKRNYLKKIITKKRRMLYNTEPTRIFKADSFLTAIYENNVALVLSNVMSRILRMVELYGYGYYSPAMGLIPPYFVWPYENGYIVHKEIILGRSEKTVFDWVYDAQERYHFINGIQQWVDKDALLEIAKDTDGGLPVIENYDLAKMQTEITKLYTVLKYGHVLQCLNPLLTDDIALTWLDLTPGKINYKSKESTIEKLQLNPHLAETLKFVLHLQEGFFEDAGIPRVSIVGDVAANSAKELIVKWFPLLEIFNELSSFYCEQEKRVIDIMFRGMGVKIFAFDFSVKYDASFIPQFGETIEETRFKLNNDILTKIDLLKRENPTLTDSQIAGLLESNKAENLKNPIKTEAQIANA